MINRSGLAPLVVAVLFLGPAARVQARGSTVVTSLTIFAGTSDGLWRSRSWGTEWEKVVGRSSGDSPDRIGAVRAIHTISTEVFVAGDTGLYHSTDFGETWKRLQPEIRGTALLTSRYHESDPTVFVGTEGGLLRSLDGGQGFAPTALREAAVYRIEWPGPALIAATSRGVFVSTNAGDSFTEPGAGLPEGPVQALAISSFYPVDPVLFGGVGRAGVFHSSDGARTWRPAGLAGDEVTDLVWLGPVLYAVTDHGVQRTRDLGRSWERLGEKELAGVVPYRILFPLAPDSGAEAFLATDRGVYHTSDGGGSWTPSGLAGRGILAIATFPPSALPAKRR